MTSITIRPATPEETKQLDDENDFVTFDGTDYDPEFFMCLTDGYFVVEITGDESSLQSSLFGKFIVHKDDDGGEYVKL
jgi:hypothetical protein